jgi:hypothetical protein
MRTFFTSERFGGPQAIAALLLLLFLLQCTWLVSRTLRTHSGIDFAEQERIHEGLRQWRRQAIAGTPAATPVSESSIQFPQRDGYDTNRSPLWYLVAAAPLVVWPGHLGPETLHYWGWLARAPYFVFGLLLGASLWYVARRLFGNAGGYIALALYCFSPSMIITTSAGPFVEPEMGAVWGSFGAVFTAIAVAHTLYAPREVVLWNWRRIVLLALSLALAIGSQFSFVVLLPLTLGFMFWVAPARRGAVVAIWVSATLLGTLQLWAAYGFHARVMWQSLRHANFLGLSGQAFATAGVYRQVGAVIAKSSPALMIALPVALAMYAGWRRARYFGNTAPLLVALLFVVLGMANPHFPGAGFHLAAVVFLFMFVAGVAADLLETRHRSLIAAGLTGLLAASALWNVLQLAGI